MIYGVFHQGSGLGNQLHRYVATRVKAADLGVEWAMLYNPDGSGKEEGFKGKSFMDIGDFWPKPPIPDPVRVFTENKLVDASGVDVRGYDPEFNFVQDDTIIDGEFQDERYWSHHEKDLNDWLKVEPLQVPDDLCMIGFRGGEFSLYPDLFLKKEYWDGAIEFMRNINPDMKFQVHTDDPKTAKEFFPDLEVIHDIGTNWRSMRFAKYAIIANSSFFILPRWMRKGVTVAPRYWARHNIETWSLPQNFYNRFIYR